MRKKIIFLLCIINVFLIFDVFKNKILFRSANTFSENKISFDSIQSIDIEYIDDLIRKIPYKNKGNENLFNVLPIERYDLTIINGYGNCSNFVYGASYKLLMDLKEFYIINFYPKDNWSEGQGHTVLMIKVGKDFVFLDIIEGGLVYNLNKNNPFGKKQSLNFKSYSLLKDNINSYFPNVLDYETGILRSNDVKEYFRFLEMIHIPLPSKKIEKYIYDSLSIFFGKFPTIFVNDKNMLLTKFENFRFQFYLWWLRVMVLSVFTLFLRWLIIVFNKKLNVWNIR